MSSLAAKIRERIERHGPITFAAFMQMALYEPGLGYYTRAEANIGPDADFYTSPHLHPVFGALLARQMEEMWEIMGRPAVFDIVEAGGGRGYLAKDMLDALRNTPLLERITYTLVELNPVFRKLQEELLDAHRCRIAWVSSLRDVEGVRGCIVSNEVLDALPVHLIRMNHLLEEIFVAVKGNSFVETFGPPSTSQIKRYLSEFGISLPFGYRSEVHLALRQWLDEASQALSEGFLLTMDYGHPAREYYEEGHDRGTLLCYREHQISENPLEQVGRQDITAHVNWTAVKLWGEALGLQPVGFCRQGPFLVSLGIAELISDIYHRAADPPAEVRRIKGLILAGTMGDSHQVMIQYRGEGSPTLRGFAMNNRIQSL